MTKETIAKNRRRRKKGGPGGPAGGGGPGGPGGGYWDEKDTEDWGKYGNGKIPFKFHGGVVLPTPLQSHGGLTQWK